MAFFDAVVRQAYAFDLLDGIGNRLAASDGTSTGTLANNYIPDALNQYTQVQSSGRQMSGS